MRRISHVSELTGRRSGAADPGRPDDLSRLLAQAAVSARDAERARIGRELHDGPAQIVGAARMELSRLSDLRPELGLERVIEALGGAFDALRRTSHALLGPESAVGGVDDSGLSAALARTAQGLERAAGIPVACRAQDVRGRISAAAAHHLLRIASEACANIARHAEAAKASIRLSLDCDEVILEVMDDGRGLTNMEGPVASESGAGLVGMRERARAIDARFTIEGAAGRGTRVRVVLPAPGVARQAGPLAADGLTRNRLGPNS